MNLIDCVKDTRVMAVATVMAFSSVAMGWYVSVSPAELQQTESVILQGQNLDQVLAAVDTVGGEVTHELSIIDAAGVVRPTKGS